MALRVGYWLYDRIEDNKIKKIYHIFSYFALWYWSNRPNTNMSRNTQSHYANIFLSIYGAIHLFMLCVFGVFCIIGKAKKLSTYITFRAESFTVSGLSPPKDDGALEKSNILIKQPSRCYQEITEKSIKGLLGIIGSVAEATSWFCGKAFGFVTKHTPAYQL